MKIRSGRGSLIVVGTGVTALAQITPEARHCMERAEKLLYLMNDLVTEDGLRSLNPTAESLNHFYGVGKLRSVTYQEMVDRIFYFVHRGLRVCVALYGHPGVFSFPGHEAVRRARREGFPARMIPGISSLDCLFADVGLDPGLDGCQIFLASDFLRRSRKFAPTSALVLLQPAVIGELRVPLRACNREGLKILTRVLQKHYRPGHQVVIYEASQFVVADPVIRRVRLANLAMARMSPLSTLYVPPRGRARRNRRMQRLLANLDRDGSRPKGRKR